MQDSLQISDSGYILWCITVAWTNLRGTSYGLDSIDYYQNVVLKQKNRADFNKFLYIHERKYAMEKYLAYCSFLPTLTTGPIILYDTFERGFLVDDGEIRKKYVRLFCQIGRYGFWLLFTEIILHFLYTNAMERYPWVRKYNY